MGTRLGLAALEAVADRFATPVDARRRGGGLGDADHALPRRFEDVGEAPALAAVERDGHDPAACRTRRSRRSRRCASEYDAALEEARASGDRGKVKLAYYQAAWARKIEAQLRDGTAPTEVHGPVHAVRIGDGVIVTGPGETFTEYGIAVKERSPGRADALRRATRTSSSATCRPRTSTSTAATRPATATRASACRRSSTRASSRSCVETGVRLAERLFPEAEPWDAVAGLDGARRRCRGSRRRRSSTRRAPSRRRAREPRAHRRDRRRLLGLVPLPAVLPRPSRRRPRRRRPQGRPGLDAFQARVRARGGDELRRRAARRRRRRRRRLLAARLHREHAVAALEAGAHVLVEKPMAVKLADARGDRRPPRAAAGRTVAVALRLELLAADDLGEGDARGRPHRPRHVRHRLHVELPDRALLGQVRVRRSSTSPGSRRGGDRDTWARADAGGGYLYGQLSHLLGLGLWLVPERAGGRLRPRELPRERRSTSTSRSRSGSRTA